MSLKVSCFLLGLQLRYFQVGWRSADRRIKVHMKRTNVWIKDDHMRKLKVLSGETGVPVSAVIRKAIALYLESQSAGRPAKKR